MWNNPLEWSNMSSKVTISLCMIVKNEKEYLAKCLTSVQDVVELLIAAGENGKFKELLLVFASIKEKKILLEIVKLYEECGLYDKGEERLIRYLKQSDFLDEEGLELLIKYRRHRE